METRSRKRAEVSPSSTSSVLTKRSRTSSASAPVAATAYSICTRSRTASLSTPMDPTPEPSTPSTSTNRGRRGKASSNNKKMDTSTNNNNNKRNKSKGNTNSDKGKGKESEIRPRDTGRSVGLNISSQDADSRASVGDVRLGDLPPNLTSASTALHGLLRKLGAGLDEFLPSSAMRSSHQSETLNKILMDLRADGEEGRQVDALAQLSDMLSIGTEDSLGSFSLDSFVPVLVGLLSYEGNPDIMLLAARALTHLVDVLPSACAAVVRYGAVSCFVARLLTIEYMDLAEQSLQALKKISQEQPTPCLRAGALMAVLSYLDFFPTGIQRVALSTAENMCLKLPSDASDFVMEAVPLLTNLLQYNDAKVIEHASICLTKIAEAFASSPEKLDELCSHGIVTQAATLISSSGSGGGQASLSTSTYTGLIHLLATCASSSALGAKSLLLLGISGILKELLLGSGIGSNMSISPALGRPPEQIFEIVNLANELLPPFPQGTISLPASTSLFVGWSLPEKGHVGSSGHLEDSSGNIHKSSTREELLNEQPGLLQQFGMDLLPVLVQIYGSSVNGPVRHKCLSVIGKIMHFSSSETIQSLTNVTNISSFLAGVLAWKDPQVLVPALQIAEILMVKLPDTFSRTFVREGVVHAVDALILTEGGSTSQPSSDKKFNDSIPGSSSRSRRNRKRGVNSCSVANVVDESNISAPSKISSLNSVGTPIVNSCLRVTVSAHAKVFKDKYFPSDTEASGAGVADDLIQLKNLCTRLNMGVDEQKRKSKGKSKAPSSQLSDIYAEKEEQLVEVIAEVLQELSREDGASTFEFMGSGVVSSLLNYFTFGYFSKQRISEGNIVRLRPQAIRRYKSFISLALPSNDEGNVVPMSILVRKLQNALSSLERFPLAVTHTSGLVGGTTRVSSGLRAISHSIKLRLSRAQGEKSLVDFSSNVLLVDPLTSLTAIEDFLFPRVQQNESGQEPSPSAGKLGSHTTPVGTSISLSERSRSSSITGETTRIRALQEKGSSSSRAKGKAIVKPTQEDAKGPRTRSAVRRRQALDKDNKVKPVYGDTSSEENELDILRAEINEGLVIEDDYISDDDDYSEEDDDIDDVLRSSTLGISMPGIVHEIKLGDSAEGTPVPASTIGQNKQTGSASSRDTSGRGSDSNELSSGSPFGSRGALSFATAAMAGIASANNIGLSGAHSSLSNDPPKLIFTSGGRQVNGQMTIYQAIQSQLVLAEGDTDDDRFAGSDLVSSNRNRLWTDIHTIMYQRADIQPERSSKSSKARASSSDHASLLDSIMQGELPCDLDKNNPTYNILALLRVLEGLNQLAPRLLTQVATDTFSEGKASNLDKVRNTSGARVTPEDFVNSKLTSKVAQQIQSTLALCTGPLPSWCYQLTKACPFLFPFETRQQYFYSTAFGFPRALNRLQQQQQGANGHGSMSERMLRVGGLQRQKVRVSRDRILESAAKVMEMYSSKNAVLEVEYVGEVGTGLGPTLEFYTLLSHDLQKDGLGMWRPSSSDTGHMPLGLFPRPWPPSADSANGVHFSEVVEYFRLLGRVIAKALQDGRLLDLPLSAAFYKLVLGQELDLHDIISFDAELGSTLQEFRALICRREYMETVRSCNPEELRFRGASIQDLCLDFSLPGYPEYILKPVEENVDMSTLGDFVALVVDATVGTGIMRQMEAFRSGFNQVFDISTLRIFSPSELDHLLCGCRELWKAESLADHMKFDHGYTSKSPTIIYLLEIMGELNPDQQRAFCQFVTGAPRLPPGGLAVLKPKLTIVRKLSSSASKSAQNNSGLSECADDDLPSVMTCANYLKLPPYSSKEIMYKKLLYAISEGQGYFDLS